MLIKKQRFLSVSVFSAIFVLFIGACGGDSGDKTVTPAPGYPLVSHLAGPLDGAGSTDGTGTYARFNYPYYVTSDGTYLYATDTDNSTIRRIVISTGAVTTIAGSAGVTGSTDGTGTSARFYYPRGITNDGTSIYVVDTQNHTIRKIVKSTGEVTTLAGSPGLTGSANGIGSAARFSYPDGITNDATYLYVTDTGNHTIRRIGISTGQVSTIAGSAGLTGSTDGTGSAARFYYPNGITNDGTYLYVADNSNHTIRRIVISTNAVTTIAGSAGSSGSADGTGSAARFSYPVGITSDGTYLYVADNSNHTIRRIVIFTNAVTTIAGTAGSSGSTDGTGSAARFSSPRGITNDGTYLYVTDYNNHTMRMMVISTGAVTTIAGTAQKSGSTDGTGAAARFNTPIGVTSDGTYLYVADNANSTIRRVLLSTGAVTTIAGSAGLTGSTDGTGSAARFYYPNGITNDGSNLYVADQSNSTIRKIVISTGEVTTIAGSAGLTGSTDGTGSAARFSYPGGIINDGTYLYVADYGNHTVRRITISTAEVATIAGSAGNSGSADGTGTAARFQYPDGITNEGSNLYVADTQNHTIRKIVKSTGEVTTIAGSAGLTGSTDGTGSAARFYNPEHITNDGVYLYVADYMNHAIRKITISAGEAATFAGTARICGSTDGTGTTARFYYPYGITRYGTNLYVSEGNHDIRKIENP